MPTTYSFVGNATTFFGAIAILTIPFVLYWIFRSFYNSPYNVSVNSRNEEVGKDS
jgi:hypothetical protein